MVCWCMVDLCPECIPDSNGTRFLAVWGYSTVSFALRIQEAREPALSFVTVLLLCDQRKCTPLQYLCDCSSVPRHREDHAKRWRWRKFVPKTCLDTTSLSMWRCSMWQTTSLLHTISVCRSVTASYPLCLGCAVQSWLCRTFANRRSEVRDILHRTTFGRRRKRVVDLHVREWQDSSRYFVFWAHCRLW